MIKVFFDSSVIVAALLSSQGASRRLLELTKEGSLAGITSESCLEEINNKIDSLRKTREEFINLVGQSKLFVRKKITEEEANQFRGEIADPKDAHVIAGAKLTKCHYLVTLDKKHLLAIKDKFIQPRILTPKELLNNIYSK